MRFDRCVLSTAVHAALSLGLTIAMGVAGSAHAQDAAQAQNDKPQKPQTMQTIMVTGTRIKKADLADQTPVQTITSEEIQKTGLATIGDVLQQLSISGSALNTRLDRSGNFGAAPDGSGVGAGATTMSLRGIGAKRTLILVDGLRWINGSSASGVSAAVDLSTIPASIIQRIDILTDGASALYGSDAIGGVINIITKQSQKGASAHVYFGDHQVGDGKTWSGDLSFGGQGDRYQFFVDASHYKQNAISAADWARSSTCIPGTGLATCSSDTPAARITFTAPGGDTYGGLCPNGICNITANGATFSGVPKFPEDYHRFGTADRYVYGPTEQLLTPSKLSGLFASVQYQVTDNVKLYFRGLYHTRSSSSQAAPIGTGVGPAISSEGSNTFTHGVDVTNPYNPFPFSLVPSDPNMGVQARMVDAAPRIYDQNVHTRYFSTGLTGTFNIGERGYNWDFNLVNAVNDATQIATGLWNASHVIKALGPLAECQADPACVPLNIFGAPGARFTPEMLNYIGYTAHSSSHQSMGIVTANISGDVVKLPAGWLDFAAGYEHRHLKGDYQPDPGSISGDTGGIPVLPTSGGYNVDEAYVELNVPLLAGVPFAKSLSVDLASRYSDYSTFAGTTNSKAGFRWQLDNDLTLRGTWAQGFRAPSIGELFGAVTSYSARVTDPCNFNSPLMNPRIAANCRALGVPDPSTFQQQNIQINAQVGGNPHLQPERARNLTLGAVYSPSWATDTAWSRALDFSLTYYKIELKDAITAPDAQTLLNRCAETLEPLFCAASPRTAAGFISSINDTLENLGRIDTNGFDFGVTWTGNETAIGRFSASWQSTYVKHFRTIDGLTGQAEPLTVGTEATDNAVPRIRSQMRLNWTRGDWSAAWTLRYISDLVEGCGSAGGFPICTGAATARFPEGTHHMGSMLYNDARLSWRLPIKLPVTVAAGINNVFDREPPLCLSCQLYGYDATTYDLPGRFWYMEGTVKF